MAEVGTQQDAGAATGATDVEEFASILKQSFKPRSERAEQEVENALATFIEEALDDQDLIQDEALDTITAMIARIDQKLTDQINEVLHAPEFQQIEGAWRGLKYLVFNSETDSTLKLAYMNASKNELYRHLKRYPDANWDQSPLFKAIYEEEYGQLGGEPYGCIVGDYHFSQTPTDVQLLGDMARIAAAAHAPFLAGAAPEVLQLDSWTDLPKRRDLSTLFDLPDYAAWNSLRDSEDARYVALCMPRALGRLPYGRKSEPVDEIPSFEEETDGHAGEKYCWINAAYTMAANINRAHKEWGWTVRIRGVLSGGEVEDLPAHVFPTDDGGTDLKCPTEVAISDRRENELSKAGLLPLIHRKNTDKAAFIGAQSLYRPKRYPSEEATKSDHLSSRLPYMFACSRFAHYLKCMMRDKIGQTKEERQLEMELQSWISRYVDVDPDNTSERVKAKKPLRDAKVTIYPSQENPGYYSSRIYLRPHYQLEGMDIGLKSRFEGA